MRLNKQSATGSVMAWTPLDKDECGSGKGGGAKGLGQSVKSRVNCSPSSCIKFKGGWGTKLPLINCRQKGGTGGGKQGSSSAYMISTLGQMMSSIKTDTAICHLFPHQSNLSVLTDGWHMCLFMCARFWRQRGCGNVQVLPTLKWKYSKLLRCSHIHKEDLQYVLFEPKLMNTILRDFCLHKFLSR